MLFGFVKSGSFKATQYKIHSNQPTQKSSAKNKQTSYNRARANSANLEPTAIFSKQLSQPKATKVATLVY